MTTSDRRIGALLGLAVGDALGAAVEFRPPGTFEPVTGYRGGGPHGLRAGEWTDDTSMALALADSLASVGWDLNDQADRYVAWYRNDKYSVNGRCFDIGGATRSGLTNYLRTGDAATAGGTHERSAGNGSIMRLAPVPIYFADLYPNRATELIQYGYNSSLPTHRVPQATSACAYMTLLLAALINGESLEVVLAPDWPMLLVLLLCFAGTASLKQADEPIAPPLRLALNAFNRSAEGPLMRIGVVKVEREQASPADKRVAAPATSVAANVTRFRIKGPDDLALIVADFRSRNGERDIRVIEASGPPQVDALENRLRMTVRRIGEGLATCDLGQARVKLDTEPFRASLFQADRAALAAGAGIDVAGSLTRRGARVGSRSDVLQDGSRMRRGWCCAFPEQDDDIPLVAFVTTRVLPVLNMWFAAESCTYEDYRVPSRSSESRGRVVYVVQLDPRAGSSPRRTKPPVYVGQTGKTRADRFREHKIGYKKSKHVHRHGLRLMPELYPKQRMIHSSDEAEAVEAAWAQEFRERGHLVFGGH